MIYNPDKLQREYHRLHHDLHVVDGVLCYRDHIVVHAAHQGVSSMAGRIDEMVFWPGRNPYIIKTRGGCMTCVREAPSQPAGFPVSPPSLDFP